MGADYCPSVAVFNPAAPRKAKIVPLIEISKFESPKVN
jgi:hypothetical protein